MPRKRPRNLGLSTVASLSATSRGSTDCEPTITTESMAAPPRGIAAQPHKAKDNADAQIRIELVENTQGCKNGPRMRIHAALAGFALACSPTLAHPPYAPQPQTAWVGVDSPP